MPYIWHFHNVVKTTVYLDENELRDLKILAARSHKANVAGLIREALRDLLRNRRQKTSFPFLKKTLRCKPSRTSFGDAVGYQRALRKEWH